MALNPALLQQLEGFGMTNDLLLQLLGICERGPGRATWHVDREGTIAKVELTFFGTTRDSRSMRDLTQLLHKER